MKESDKQNSHISSNLRIIYVLYLLIMVNTLLLRPSLHFITLHLTSRHYTCRQFSRHRYFFHFTQFTIAFLNLVLKILGLQSNVPNASAGSILEYVHFSTSPKRDTDLPSKVFASFYPLHLLCNDVHLLKTAPSLLGSCQQHYTQKTLQKVRYYASLHFVSYSPHTHTHTHTHTHNISNINEFQSKVILNTF
jgi:hypothetical protein